MSSLIILAAAVLIHAKINNTEQKARVKALEKATSHSRAIGRPLLIIGRPRGRHSAGNWMMNDVCIDLDPAIMTECPETGMVADITKPLPFPDKHFGASIFMHVLEHVNNPLAAIEEAARVSDMIFIAYPMPYSLVTWLHPGHRYVIRYVDGILALQKNPLVTV